MALYTYAGNVDRNDGTEILLIKDRFDIMRIVRIGEAIDISPAQLDALSPVYSFVSGGTSMARAYQGPV